ncbi:MAG: hypothetical protein EB037_07690 [Actinobacteria bacterium]|nr:hypothetical protein [Actinomycetota bacterium]
MCFSWIGQYQSLAIVVGANKYGLIVTGCKCILGIAIKQGSGIASWYTLYAGRGHIDYTSPRIVTGITGYADAGSCSSIGKVKIRSLAYTAGSKAGYIAVAGIVAALLAIQQIGI